MAHLIYKWINPLLFPCKSLGLYPTYEPWVVRHQVQSGHFTVCSGNFSPFVDDKNDDWLVVEPPTPLKNDGARQLG